MTPVTNQFPQIPTPSEKKVKLLTAGAGLGVGIILTTGAAITAIVAPISLSIAVPLIALGSIISLISGISLIYTAIKTDKVASDILNKGRSLDALDLTTKEAAADFSRFILAHKELTPEEKAQQFLQLARKEPNNLYDALELIDVKDKMDLPYRIRLYSELVQNGIRPQKDWDTRSDNKEDWRNSLSKRLGLTYDQEFEANISAVQNHEHLKEDLETQIKCSRVEIPRHYRRRRD